MALADDQGVARVLPTGVRRALSGLTERLAAWRNRRIASSDFQTWASGFPLTRGVARREAARLYDLVAGFTYSQTLLACVELGVFESLRDGPRTIDDLAADLDGGPAVDPERLGVLCQAAAALDLLERVSPRRYRLGPLGAAALGAPGLLDMIRHHRIFYRDLADPVALLRGEGDPELSRFWSYVDGQRDQPDGQAVTYSELMASSQTLVAEETLRAVSFEGVRRVLDVGGGAGAFLTHVASAYPSMELMLFDLPAVVREAERRFDVAGLAGRARAIGGSFHEDPIPGGADLITLVRVLYDHDDAVVASLLSKVRAALPVGGRVVVSEPMSGGARPSRAGDAYFGFYTMAMTSGRPRSPERHAALLEAAGFEAIRTHKTVRPFITGVISARKVR